MRQKSFHPTRNKNEIERGFTIQCVSINNTRFKLVYTCLTWTSMTSIDFVVEWVFFSICAWATHWIFPWELAEKKPFATAGRGGPLFGQEEIPSKDIPKVLKVQLHPNIPLIVSHLHIQLRSQHPICKKKSKSSKKQIQKYNCKNHFSNFCSPGTYFGEATTRTTEHVGLLKHFKSFRWNGPILEPRTVTTVTEL